MKESDRKPGTPDIIVPKVPTEEELNAINDLCHTYNEALNDIVCYLYDLTAEAQNILLSGLFDNRVPARQPLDPSYIVITTDEESMNKLDKYFNEKTAWGRNQQKVKGDVLASMSESADNKQKA